jgi:hypothetical protein
MDRDFVRTREEPVSEWASSPYERDVVDGVWQHGEALRGNDPELWRKDEFGAWIRRLDYGNRRSEFGWEILDPRRGRGTSGVAMLRPVHWQNYIDQVAAHTQSRIMASGLRNTRRLL